MKAVNFFTMMIAMMAMSVSFSSCSGDDDDDPVSGIHDYYIECNVSGGGLDASELTELKSELNLIMTDFDLDAMDNTAVPNKI